MKACIRMLCLAVVVTAIPLLPGRAAEKIISLGGDVTEIVYALGKGESVVAVDLTSTYPAEATKLPRVGYVRQLSTEGILAMKPEMVLATGDAGPPQVLEQLEAADVKVVMLPKDHSVAGIRGKIAAVADALDAKDEGSKLLEQFDAEYEAAKAAAGGGEKLKAVYVMGRPDGTLSAAGKDTAADAVLAEAGLSNVTGSHVGYKPISAEALVASNPDVIVTGTRTVEGAGGLDQFRASPALSATEAARNNRILVFDDMYLLGLGPRTAQAVKELAVGARK